MVEIPSYEFELQGRTEQARCQSCGAINDTGKQELLTCCSTRPEGSSFHAAVESRRQVVNLTYVVKNVNIVEFHGHIWNHHEKCIQHEYKHAWYWCITS